MIDLGDLVPIVLFLSIAWAIVAVTRSIMDSRVRRRLIDAGATAEVVGAVTTRGDDPGLFTALKWGLVVSAVGLALVLMQLFSVPQGPISLGLPLLFGAVGLLLYYILARRVVERETRRREKAVRQTQ
jgi:choline-glycine betaine transporter